MKVLGLVSSPRKPGNSEICVKEIFRSLPKDWDKEIINLSQFHLEPCKACYACLSSGKHCVLQDDLALVLEKIRQADRLVLAAPVYFLGEHTSIKLLSDRLIGLLNEPDFYAHSKPCVIAVPHGIKNWEGYGREAMLNLAYFLGLKVLDIRVLNRHLPGDVVDEEGLTILHTLATELTNNTERNWQDTDALCCPHCHSSLLQIHKNGGWHCVMCGENGLLTATEDGLAAPLSTCCKELGLNTQASAEPFRYSPQGLAHHGQALLDVNTEFRSRRREVIQHLKEYKD